MRIIVVYDISDNSSRLKIAERLKGFGLTRVQRSAFVGPGGTGLAKDIARLSRRMIDEDKDSLIVFIVPNKSVEEAIIIGKAMGPLYTSPRIWVL
ncbi:MAG: CRISPR-associated endonuclease Cas2 [Thermoprotei archaeon]|nr:CRISPR-associated endonuclease Cas2 [Thermoprotei archaeon]